MRLLRILARAAVAGALVAIDTALREAFPRPTDTELDLQSWFDYEEAQ